MSEVLQALEKVRKAKYMFAVDNQQACDVIEKELKALEIIKDKNVNIEMIKLSKDYFEYDAGTYKSIPLEQEEFDLLKEVLL